MNAEIRGRAQERDDRRQAGDDLVRRRYPAAQAPGFPANLKMSPDAGVLFVGQHGMLMHDTYGDKPVLIGAGLEDRAKKIGQSLPRVIGGMGATR